MYFFQTNNIMEEHNYFSYLLKIIENDKSQSTLLKYLINPLSPYFLCNHFFGKEIYLLPNHLITEKHDLRKTKRYDLIKDYDIVHCQVNF
jgi:hypothetical protein